MHRREKYSINGRYQGVWCETSIGNKVYLALKTSKDVFREKNAWCIDLSVLERAKVKGVSIIGVVKKDGRQKLVWLTRIEDFFDSPDSFSVFNKSRQRGLPMKKFRVDPMRCAEVIDKAMRLR